MMDKYPSLGEARFKRRNLAAINRHVRTDPTSTTQATFVGPYMAPIAANHLCHRPANRKSASRLGKREALLGEHALRFELAWGSAASKLHHTQSHDLLRLLTETRSRERKFHPRSEHANTDRGSG